VTPTPAPTALPTEVPPPTPTEAPPQPEATPTALPPTPAPEIDSATPMATPPTDGALDTPTAEPVAATTPVAEEATPNGALAVTEVAVPTAVVTLPGAREPSDAPAGLSGPAGLLVLALAYLLGGLAVLLIHSILAQRDRAKAEAMILTANKDEEDGD